MIRVDNVSHWFGAFRALTDVNIHVPANQIFGFIGPNGAGKTTTIRMMATLLEPDRGRVSVDRNRRRRVPLRGAQAAGLHARLVRCLRAHHGRRVP